MSSYAYSAGEFIYLALRGVDVDKTNVIFSLIRRSEYML